MHERQVEQLLFLRGSEGDRRWRGDPHVVPLHHVVDGHEPIEQRIDLVRLGLPYAPVPIPCEGSHGGVCASSHPGAHPRQQANCRSDA